MGCNSYDPPSAIEQVHIKLENISNHLPLKTHPINPILSSEITNVVDKMQASDDLAGVILLRNQQKFPTPPRAETHGPEVGDKQQLLAIKSIGV